MTSTYYLVLSAALFTIGAVGVLVRRNAIVVFMCVELMLNAVSLGDPVTRVSAARKWTAAFRRGTRACLSVWKTRKT